MNDLGQAIAAAREATELAVKARSKSDEAHHEACAECADALRGLLAALDAARGEAVAPVAGAYFAGLDYTGRPIYRQAEQAPPAAAVPEGCACGRYFANYSCGSNVGEGDCDCPKCQGFCDCAAAERKGE